MSQTNSILPGDEIAFGSAERGMPAVEPATDRDRGDGPYPRLILRGATVIDGTGAPPWSQVDIVIEQGRIAQIVNVGPPGRPVNPLRRPPAGDREIDCHGKVVTPGFIDCHAHIGIMLHALKGKMPTADYIYKLWLGHGITTIREPGSFNGLGWTLEQKQASADNRIAAPHIHAYAFVPAVNDLLKILHTPDQMRAWLRALRERGADGVKFMGASPALMEAALDECQKVGLRSACHHAQQAVAKMNALTTARWGLTSAEHFYGIAEAMFQDKLLQPYPADYDYNDEYHRFAIAGTGFAQAAQPGSDKWNEVLEQFLALDFTFVPTFSIYDANRDLMRARRADQHDEFTDPNLWAYFQPSREGHGSYWHSWSINDEINWKRQYQLWMHFVNDYKNLGGRVCAGSDSGFIFSTYGFGFVRELELLQEAGFNTMEVLQAATSRGAELLGIADQTGSIDVGKQADLLIHDKNPLADFKLLYGSGAMRLSEDGKGVDWVRSLQHTIRGGVVFDSQQLLDDVREMVAERKAAGRAAS